MSAPESAPLAVDAADVRLACRAGGVLADFNRVGVLSAADVHVAQRLAVLTETVDEAVLLGVALAVRAPRLAHVCTDLATVRTTATTGRDEPVDLQALPWPDVEEWVERLARSPLVAVDDTTAPRPLRLDQTRLYLHRYWRAEGVIAGDLRARRASSSPAVDEDVLAAGLRRLFGTDEDDRQRAAAVAAIRCWFAVVAGGPGTGKTTTVARILALLDEQAAAMGRPLPRVALAAPTGKAAARLEEAVHLEAATLPISEEGGARLRGLTGSTLHRLLGWRPGTRSRFRHDRANRLPHDIVVVDEASMVSLSLMAKLVDAVRADARLVLVGDPDQLASVEAGSVLGDIVGPAGEVDHPSAPMGEGIVVLRRVHRFGAGIATLAQAIQRGDADAAVAALGDGEDGVVWLDVDVAAAAVDPALAVVRASVVDAGRRVAAAAHAGDPRAALDGLRAARVLCAHRRGPYGVARWTAQIEQWLAGAIAGYAEAGPSYVGRPLLVTENDYPLRLYNGDTGVVIERAGGVIAAFDRSGGVFEISPRRLGPVETVHAMTIHKSQGSQFDAVTVILPDADSPLLTRELLYTAVTRARHQLTVVGVEDAIRAAVARPIARASGLRHRLWG